MTKIKEYTLKNGEKRYKFLYYAGVDEKTGKKKYIRKNGFITKKAAQIALARLEYQKALGEIDASTKKKVRFCEVAREWFSTYKLTVRESTLGTKESRYRKQIAPYFGDCYVDKITLQDCQKAVNEWFQAIPATMPGCIELVNSIMELARKEGYITNNPMKDVTRPRRTRTRDDNNFYTKQELNTFLGRVKQQENKKIYACFRLLAYSGIRKGELLALTWGDVDFKGKTLNIDKALTNRINGSVYVGRPKTTASIRKIALDDLTLKALLEWKYQQARGLLKRGYNANTPQQIIFDDNNGNIVKYKGSVNRWLRKIYQKNPDLRCIRVHGFRHTHCTLLLESGASIASVQERLGHSNVNTTLEVYTHVTKQVRQEAVNDFINYMEG